MPAPDGHIGTAGQSLMPSAATGTLAPSDAEGAEIEPVSRAQRQRRLGVGGVLAIGWLVFVTLAALLAPVLPLDSPTQNFPSIVSQPPGTDGHLLGGDALGRDILSRIVWGGRASLLLGVSSVLLGLLVGGLLGLVAGYFRGRADTVLTVAFDVLLSFPALILAVTLVTVFASGEGTSATRRMVVLILALGVVSVPLLGRITRANTLAWAQREFVTAARALGAKDRSIMFGEVLPNVLPAMFSIALLGVAVVIVAEGGLSVLGVGVQLPTPSWGNILAEGRADLRRAPHIVMIPTIVIFLTVLALNYLGDVVRARFDVRESAL
ncbi:MAG TPA: ABC transporter permease [Acidimicrobiales bacterium]|nr:ABC transporter permease [Acidimicrobiales bacterium]